MTAPEPYAAQIAALGTQVGAVIARQNMKDKSGASVMDPKTQVTSVHGHSVLELALQPLQANFALPLVHEIAGPNDRAMLDIAVAAEVNLVGDPILVAADAAREAGNSPNTVMAAAAAIIGPKRVERALACTRALIDLFAGSGLKDGHDDDFDSSRIEVDDDDARAVPGARRRGRRSRAPRRCCRRCATRGGKSVFLDFLLRLDGAAVARRDPGRDRDDDRLGPADAQAHQPPHGRDAALVPAPLRRDDRRLDPGASTTSRARCAASRATSASASGRWPTCCFLAMTGKKPTASEALPLQILIGLLISNGPGSISAQGAKGAVSADGPQTPGRVQINKAMVGFLTHTGYSHGGNGFEGMAFLLEQFKDAGLQDPTDPDHGIDLKAMATAFAKAYKAEKRAGQGTRARSCARLPGVHHPIFKGKPVNHDPRERFIAEFMAERGDYNIFHAFYRELVQALYDAGATPYVFCVNVDAVIAALLLALLWKDYQVRRAHRARPRDGGVHRLPLRPHDRRRRRDRRPPQPRPQHGHAHARSRMRVRDVTVPHRATER